MGMAACRTQCMVLLKDSIRTGKTKYTRRTALCEDVGEETADASRGWPPRSTPSC